MVLLRCKEVSQCEVLSGIVIYSGTMKHRCELRWDENVPDYSRSKADPVMQSHISDMVLPVDVIEGDLNSLSLCSDPFEDLLDLVGLLFNDANKGSIAA